HRARRYAALNDNPAATVFYLDPPYINKADQIYTLPFTGRDHREIAAHLKGSPHRWVLSYDAEPLIPDLYRGRSDVHRYRVTHN
ncbi:MAG: DNA adenine methylase, partial [Nocardioides sp.]